MKSLLKVLGIGVPCALAWFILPPNLRWMGIVACLLIFGYILTK